MGGSSHEYCESPDLEPTSRDDSWCELRDEPHTGPAELYRFTLYLIAVYLAAIQPWLTPDLIRCCHCRPPCFTS
jgi:hypothetical protein